MLQFTPARTHTISVMRASIGTHAISITELVSMSFSFTYFPHDNLPTVITGTSRSFGLVKAISTKSTFILGEDFLATPQAK